MEHEALTEQIIGCAYRVYNQMGSGFLESIYHKCLMIKLDKAGLKAEQEREIRVLYQDEEVGFFKADIIVEGTIILELKSIRQFATAHEVQLVNYLVATDSPVGLLLNFGPEKVDVKRKVRDLKNDSAN